jgi:hypothetical protein
MSDVKILTPNREEAYEVFTEHAIPGQQTLISAAVPMNKGEPGVWVQSNRFGIWYKASSLTGKPSIRILYDLGFDTNGAHFSVPPGIDDIETSLGDQEAHIREVVILPMKYLRVRIVGLPGNALDCKISVKVFVR